MMEADNIPPHASENLGEIEDLPDEEANLDELLQQVNEERIAAAEGAVPVTAAEPAPTEAEAEVATEAAKDEKIQSLIAEVVALRQQLEERKGQYTRLYADFDNFRKRTEREKEELESRTSLKLLKKFLSVVDDFERAQLQIKPKTDGESAIHNSYQSVYKQLVKCLKECGVTKMDAVGQPFDPNLHEAIAQEVTTEYPEGTAIDEMRAGYMLGELVMRHALVRVAVAPEDATAAAEAGQATELSDDSA